MSTGRVQVTPGNVADVAEVMTLSGIIFAYEHVLICCYETWNLKTCARVR